MQANRINVRIPVVAAALLATATSGGASSAPTSQPSTGVVVERMSLMPLAFTRNEGQWDRQALYQAK